MVRDGEIQIQLSGTEYEWLLEQVRSDMFSVLVGSLFGTKKDGLDGSGRVASGL